MKKREIVDYCRLMIGRLTEIGQELPAGSQDRARMEGYCQGLALVEGILVHRTGEQADELRARIRAGLAA